MNEYKRFTKKTIGCFQYELKNHKPKVGEFNDYDAFFDYSMAVKQLGELEDKIENGTLIELPCKVGTTLYFIYNRPHAYKSILTPLIYETNDWYFDIDGKGIAILPRDAYGYNGEYFYYLGELVFLTKAKAQARIKELQEGKK